MTKNELKEKITEIFEELFPTATEEETDLVPKSLTDGKLYEAYIVSVVAEGLATVEGFDLVLVNGNHLQLKSSPGPINRVYPRIELRQRGSVRAELWTDVEYLTLSYASSSRSTPNKGDYHELDVLVVDAGVSGRPRHDQVWLGVECKNLQYEKSLLKDILGVRRELSLLVHPNRSTRFSKWPRADVPANPPSCLIVYSTSAAIADYADPGEFFGIDFEHKPLPSFPRGTGRKRGGRTSRST